MKLFDVYPLFDIEPIKGEACYIFDQADNKYLDLYGGHAVISIGHNHPHFVEQLSTQVQRLSFYSNSVKNPLQIKLAKLLGKQSGCEGYQLFLCNSGAEANENALKMASFYNERTKIIAFHRAFHGRTSAAVNVTQSDKIKAPINKRFEVEFHPLNQIESVAESLAKEDVCAVIVEGIQGVGGIHLPHPDFLKQLQALCHQYNSVLILDEIQSGYGRSGRFFAHQYTDIQPDLITIAKGMGNGFPIGGLLLHPKFEAKYGLLGTTFGGNHLACAAGIAVLEVIEKEKLMAHAGHLGCQIMAALMRISAIKEVRGSGLMIGVELDFPVKALRQALLYEDHIFVGSSSNPNVLRLLPPLNITSEQGFYFVEKLKKRLQ
ncbi:MAG: aminotransferase class III-fold pyridoxal phosphate-dependent enzyme [Bacteroidota bacterium]